MCATGWQPPPALPGQLPRGVAGEDRRGGRSASRTFGSGRSGRRGAAAPNRAPPSGVAARPENVCPERLFPDVLPLPLHYRRGHRRRGRGAHRHAVVGGAVGAHARCRAVRAAVGAARDVPVAGAEARAVQPSEPVFQPRTLVARLQLARPRAGPRRARAADGARALPLHRLVEPRRTLPQARRRPQAAGRRARRHADARRAHACRAARTHPPERPRDVRRPRRDVARHPPPPPRHRRRRAHQGLERHRRRRARDPARVLPLAHLPRPHAPRRRSRPPVPLHLRPQPLLRHHPAPPGARHRALRAPQGADAARAVARRAREAAVRARRGGHPPQPARAVPRDGDRVGAPVPHHPQRRAEARRRGDRRPRRDDRGGAARAAVRARRAPRSGGGDARGGPRPASQRAPPAPGRSSTRPRG